MITRLEVDGFKSLEGFAVDLEPFTVLIGPNSAGKSNILEALALLSRLTKQPIAEAFKNGRGRPSDQFTRKGSETAQKMSFAVELLAFDTDTRGQPPDHDRESRFRYELAIERQTLPSGAERLVVTREGMQNIPRTKDPWIEARPQFLRYAFYNDEHPTQFYSFKEHRTSSLNTGLYQLNTASSLLYFLTRVLSADLAGCRILQVGTARLGEPSDRLESGDLNADAANLPTVLAGLPKPLLGEIRADLVALVPGMASFDVVPEGDEIHIDFELSGGDRMPARLVSDGTLRILVLLTALRLEPRPPIVCIEEPENGIYPGRLRALLDLFLAESQRSHDDTDALARLDEHIKQLGAVGIQANLLPTQILLTTHSPVLLAALRQSPQHIRFVDTVRRDGHRRTRVRTVGRPTKADHGRSTVSPREIESLLDAARSEEPA